MYCFFMVRRGGGGFNSTPEKNLGFIHKFYSKLQQKDNPWIAVHQLPNHFSQTLLYISVSEFTLHSSNKKVYYH